METSRALGGGDGLRPPARLLPAEEQMEATVSAGAKKGAGFSFIPRRFNLILVNSPGATASVLFPHRFKFGRVTSRHGPDPVGSVF